MPTLFDPIQFGAIAAPNRIVMAPLTRGRASRTHVPTDLMIDYYRQRASAGLIITEATGISQEGTGWPYAPGIWSDEQVEAWKPVTDAVHSAGGRIVVQLWHMGRLVHPDFLDGAPPVSASATTAPDKAYTYNGKQPYAQARPLDSEEIPRILDDYAHAARNALAAGFDGVQIHAANGYLIDQFLRDGANQRTDDYGGSPANRVRLLSEVTRAVVAEAGAGRTAVRFSPNGDTQGVIDSDPASVFAVAADALDAIGIAFLDLRELGPDDAFERTDQPRQSPLIRRHFRGPLVLNNGYDAERAQADLDAGVADAIAFGRAFISNPDLPERLAKKAPLAKAEMATWYTQGAEGYTDYPALESTDA